MNNIFNDIGLDMEDPETIEKLRDAVYAGVQMGNIRAERLAKGLSTAVVAERMGISEGAVERLELPGADPHMSTIRRYSLAVGVISYYGVRPIPEEE